MSKSRRRLSFGVFLVCAAVAALGAAVFLTRGKTAARAANVAVESVPRVEIVLPAEGGMRRTTVQPGTVIGFESVDLYAMVSGYLKDAVCRHRVSDPERASACGDRRSAGSEGP